MYFLLSECFFAKSGWLNRRLVAWQKPVFEPRHWQSTQFFAFFSAMAVMEATNPELLVRPVEISGWTPIFVLGFEDVWG